MVLDQEIKIDISVISLKNLAACTKLNNTTDNSQLKTYAKTLTLGDMSF